MNRTNAQAALVALLLVLLGLLCVPPAPSLVRHAAGASGEGTPVTGASSSAYFFDMQAASASRASIAVADTLTVPNVITLPAVYPGQHDTDATRPSPVGGARQNLPISIRFSSSSASVTFALATFSRIEVAGVVTERLKDLSPTYTATAGTAVDEDGLYVAPSVVLDSYAAWSARVVLVGAPSAGTVSIRVGSY